MPVELLGATDDGGKRLGVEAGDDGAVVLLRELQVREDLAVEALGQHRDNARGAAAVPDGVCDAHIKPPALLIPIRARVLLDRAEIERHVGRRDDAARAPLELTPV